MTVDMSRLDVPLPILTLQLAAAHTASPSDRIAYALDEWLITHPKACSTDADYPGWTERIAALAAANHRTPKETP